MSESWQSSERFITGNGSISGRRKEQISKQSNGLLMHNGMTNVYMCSKI